MEKLQSKLKKYTERKKNDEIIWLTKLEDHVKDLESGLEVGVGIHKAIQAVHHSSAANDILANEFTDVGPASNQATNDDRELPGRISQWCNGLEDKKKAKVNKTLFNLPPPALVTKMMICTNTSKDWMVL